jgi:hypothetical protein
MEFVYAISWAHDACVHVMQSAQLAHMLWRESTSSTDHSVSKYKESAQNKLHYFDTSRTIPSLQLEDHMDDDM